MLLPCKLLGFVCVFINDNNLEDDQKLLAPIVCHVAMMITAKNDDMTTMTAAMTTGRKAREPGDFIDADQMFCLKLSHALIFF